MKTDHPRAIDQYIDFFGGSLWVRPAALDLAAATPRTVDHGDLTASDDQLGRQRRRP